MNLLYANIGLILFQVANQTVMIAQAIAILNAIEAIYLVNKWKITSV